MNEMTLHQTKQEQFLRTDINTLLSLIRRISVILYQGYQNMFYICVLLINTAYLAIYVLLF